MVLGKHREAALARLDEEAGRAVRHLLERAGKRGAEAADPIDLSFPSAFAPARSRVADRIARRTASGLARDSFGFDATYSRTDATRFLDRLAVMLRTLCAHPKPIVGYRLYFLPLYMPTDRP